MGFCVILSTCPSSKAAETIAQGLVENRLAACVQITAITSFYEWGRQVHRDAEHLLIIKAKAGLYHDIEAFILKQHSYDVPEIVQIPISNGFSAYLDWIRAVSK
jgi:periplasmic divalent cation tolerance protein